MKVVFFSPRSRCQPSYFHCTGKGKNTPHTHTLSTHSVIPLLPWIFRYGWWQWKASSFLPTLLPLPSISPAWIWSWVTPGELLSPISALPRHCKYIHSAGAERVCCRNRKNPHVGGLIPKIVLRTLLLWHCHSIVLCLCGQGCLLWPLSSPGY